MGTAGAVDSLVDGLDALREVDLDALSDAALDALLGDLQRIGHRLDALICRTADRWSQRGVWASDGSKSAAARLGRDGHRSHPAAHAILRRGRRLGSAPHVSAAFGAGDVSVDHVDVLLGTAVGREELFARDEALLVEHARSLRFDPMRKALDYWRQRADTELGVDGAEPHAAPGLTLTPVGGVVAVDGQLDPLGAAIVGTTLEKLADELAADDAACGRPTRSRSELRAAAFVEMARRALAMPEGAHRARILLQIVCGHDTFARLCEMSDGTVIRPDQIVPYLHAVDVRSIVFSTATHAIAASTQRSFTGALRAAIQVRDRHCQHPSACDEPIDRCDIDHITPWSQGGTTDQHNGRLLCTFHNRIEPQHTRPPTTIEQRGVDDDEERYQVDELRLWPPPGNRLVIYHLTHTELRALGP